MQTDAISSEIRTFLIADVRGYTKFTLERGDLAGAQLASRFAELTREAVGAYGGDVLELRGDEALVVFGSTRSALRSAVALQEHYATHSQAHPDLPVRVGIGLDAGEAIPTDGGYRGAALNLAARLCSIAAPGEVLCTESVVHLARKLDGLEYRARSMEMLKGFSEPVAVVQVVRSDGESTPDVTPASNDTKPVPVRQALPTGGFLGSLPHGKLVAREQELRQILLDTESAACGTGRVVLVAGEPGAGKTRLAQEVTLHLHGSGFLITSGRCYEPERSIPYYPFLDVLSTLYAFASPDVRRHAAQRWPYLGILLPDQIEVPGTAGGQEDEQRVFRAVTSFLQVLGTVQPIAILIDDLHWADSASIKLLQHLARHTTDLPIFTLGTYRDVEVGRHHPLETALRELNRERLTTRVDVRRFTEDGTAALVSETMHQDGISAEFVHLVHQRTEGNPYFVEQVMRALIERGDVFQQDGHWERREIDEIEIPESVRSIVGDRLARLEPSHQEALLQASVLGQTFNFDDLMGMGDFLEADLEDALQGAAAIGLVRTTGGEVFAFDHALTQQSLYEELSPRKRRRFHRAAGEALEALPESARQGRVGELAWHFLHADDTDRALLYSVKAGDAAEAVFAHADAEPHYRTALEITRDNGDARGEAEALQKLGGALRLAGRYAESHDVLEIAAEVYQRLGDREGELGVVAQIGRMHSVQGTSDEGIKRVLPVVLALEQEGVERLSSTCTASLYVSLAALYFHGGKWQDFLRVSEEAVRLSEDAGDEHLIAEAALQRGTALSLLGDVDNARTTLTHAVDLATTAGDLLTVRNALNNIAYLQRRAGDLRGAADSYRQALEYSESLGTPGDIAFARFVLGRLYIEQGRWAEARILFEDALHAAQAAAASWYSSYAMAGLGYLNVLEGRNDEGVQQLEKAIEIAERNEDAQGLIIHSYLAVQEILDGRADDAVARLVRVQSLTRSAGREIFLWPIAWALIELGRETEACTVLQKVREHELFEGHLEWPDILRISGMAAVRQRRWEDAGRDLDEALTIAHDIGMPFQEALIEQEIGNLHVARGDRDTACRHLQDALRMFIALGAHPYAQRARDALARLES